MDFEKSGSSGILGQDSQDLSVAAVTSVFITEGSIESQSTDVTNRAWSIVP